MGHVETLNAQGIGIEIVRALLRAKPDLGFRLTPPHTPFQSLEVGIGDFVQELRQSFSLHLFDGENAELEKRVRNHIQNNVTLAQVCNGIAVDIQVSLTTG